MECWAALSYCKRDVERGPINPRQPKDFQNFGLLEYRQELRACSLNQFYKYECREQDSELCFEVLRNFQEPLPGAGPGSASAPFPHEIGVQFPSQQQQVVPAFLATTPRPSPTTTSTTSTTTARRAEEFGDSDLIFPPS